jgi:hypothetical protein
MGFRAVGVGDPERYLLRTSAARIGVDDVASMSRDEHRHAFLAFVARLIGDSDRYLGRDEIDPLRDGASYNLAAMWLNDAELAELARELNILFQPRLANTPKLGSKRRILATVLLPGHDTSAEPGP